MDLGPFGIRERRFSPVNAIPFHRMGRPGTFGSLGDGPNVMLSPALDTPKYPRQGIRVVKINLDVINDLRTMMSTGSLREKDRLWGSLTRKLGIQNDLNGINLAAVKEVLEGELIKAFEQGGETLKGIVFNLERLEANLFNKVVKDAIIGASSKLQRDPKPKLLFCAADKHVAKAIGRAGFSEYFDANPQPFPNESQAVNSLSAV